MVENNPFAEFGGEEVKSKPIITENPFSEFGGTEIDETELMDRIFHLKVYLLFFEFHQLDHLHM